MKKLLFVFAGIAVALAGYSQISYGVQVKGLLASTRVKSQYNIDFEKDPAITPGGGIVFQLELSDALAVRAAANYQQQGARLKVTEDQESSTTSKARFHYAQVPVQLIYKIAAGSNAVYGGLGGYAAYGFAGKIKTSFWHQTSDGGYTIEEKLKAFKKTEDGGANLSRFDAGLSGVAGLKFSSGLFVQIGYQYGLVNFSRDKADIFNNRAAELTIGYFFR